MSNLVNEKYGYDENVEYDDEYQNVDYRDGIVYPIMVNFI